MKLWPCADAVTQAQAAGANLESAFALHALMEVPEQVFTTNVLYCVSSEVACCYYASTSLSEG
jgi:hypothetical protein